MTKIAVIDDWQGVARASADWTALSQKAEIVFFEDALDDEDAIAARMRDFDIIMTMRERTPFPASLIAKLPRLRMLSITGRRNRSVDIDALTARGITVTHTESGESGHATAELTLCLMLSAARNVPAGDATIRAGGFQKGLPVGFTLHGKTLGLVGLGRLGSLVASYANTLGMKLLAWSPNLTRERAAEAKAELATKEELFSRADVISVHMVLAPTTVGLIGRRELGLMKRGAIIVNTSRGPLIDEPALLQALDENRIVAALDVYDREPLPPDHPLRRARNAVLSPHLGYCVRENFAVFHQQAIENVLGFLAGTPIRLLAPGS